MQWLGKMVLVMMLVGLPALAREYRYRVPDANSVFASVGSLDKRAYMGVWSHAHGCKDMLYRVRVIRVDQAGLYFLDKDIIEHELG